MMTWSQLRCQDALSPVMEELMQFHDLTMVIVCFILRRVGLVLGGALKTNFIHQNLLESQEVECVWTLIPAMVLCAIATPSLALLYLIEDRVRGRLRLKAVGHQWYWSYEYRNFWGPRGPLAFDSYIREGQGVRLLDVDRRAVIPYQTHVQILVRSADVLHSWAVPALGVKADGCPGRINQLRLLRHRPGVFYGQCREICGANHRFMPIGTEFVRPGDFSLWVEVSN